MKKTCHDCLAELVNRHIALDGMIKIGDLEQAKIESSRMDAHIVSMILCKTKDGRLKYDTRS